MRSTALPMARRVFKFHYCAFICCIRKVLIAAVCAMFVVFAQWRGPVAAKFARWRFVYSLLCWRDQLSCWCRRQSFRLVV